MHELFVNGYVPAIRESTANIVLTDQEKSKLLDHFTGAILKILYAFLWQVCNVLRTYARIRVRM